MNAAQSFPHTFIQNGEIRMNPAQAGMIVRDLAYERQRAIVRAHVITLCEAMRRGHWLDRTPIDFARLPTGQLILINGHHRLTAQSESGRDIIWQVNVRECSDMEDVRALYYRFDTNVRARTTQNILQGIDFAGQHDMPKTIASALWHAAPVIGSGMRMERATTVDQLIARNLADERLKLMDRYAHTALRVDDFISLAPMFMRKKMVTASFFAVALVTTFHHPDQAEKFWRGMALDDGLRRGDPRKTLLSLMAERSGQQKVITHNLVLASKAWNAWFQNKPLMLLRFNKNEVVKLAGTVYTVQG